MSTHNDEPVLDCLLGRIEWRDNITRPLTIIDPKEENTAGGDDSR